MYADLTEQNRHSFPYNTADWYSRRRIAFPETDWKRGEAVFQPVLIYPALWWMPFLIITFR